MIDQFHDRTVQYSDINSKQLKERYNSDNSALQNEEQEHNEEQEQEKEEEEQILRNREKEHIPNPFSVPY